MKNLVWLASYPKSGNTWLRLFFANYLTDSSQPVPINQIDRFSTGDSVVKNYQAVSGKALFNPRDDKAALRLRDGVFRKLSSNGAGVNLLKTHCKNAKVESVQLIPPHLTRAAIYVVRNPLDMLVSYADHYGLTVESAADDMKNPNATILPEKHAVRQFTGNWSDHVRSWTRNPKFPVTVLRYEDMLAHPQESFERVIDALGAPVDSARVGRAVVGASFDEARKQEAAMGFKEKSGSSERFFRSGKAGQGAKVLPEDVASRIRSDHHDVMDQFGYLQ